MDRVLTPAAAIVTAPPARPTAGDNTIASSRDDGSFARALETQRETADPVEEPEAVAAQAGPAPATTPVQPGDLAPAVDGVANNKSAARDANAAAEFRAALNNLTPNESAPASVTAESDSEAVIPTSGPADMAADTNTAQPAEIAGATTQAVQTSAAAIALASAGGTTVASPTEESGDTASKAADDTSVIDGDLTTVVAIIAPAPIPSAAPVTVASNITSAKMDPAIQPAALSGADTPLPSTSPPSPAGDTIETLPDAPAPKTENANPSAAAPQGANPALANAHPAASSATQSNAQVQAAAAADSAAAAVPSGTSPTPPASVSPQAATANNPLNDASRAPATPPALQSAPAAAIQVYSRIVERADGRAQRFEVRLDPVELGRVDVRIEIGADRKVHAVLAAHDSAALTDLMRGQRALERALSDAGIDLADKGLRFELSADTGRGGANQQRDGDANGRGTSPDAWRKFDTIPLPVSAETAAAATPAWRVQRLDLVA